MIAGRPASIRLRKIVRALASSSARGKGGARGGEGRRCADEAVALSRGDHPPSGCGRVAVQVDLQLGVAVAAVLKAEGLELVVPGGKTGWVQLHVTPCVAGAVLSAIDADEGS